MCHFTPLVDAAFYFDIKPYERDRFEKGKEPQRIWEWLEQTKRLGELDVFFFLHPSPSYLHTPKLLILHK
ncbi:hypothetical protein [Fischerella sp. JS2]|uniref:hypothetical protein n=1 Tax=Fischerella sp. JS2 TaxID=2597771 RepID=UPI0037C18D8E